MNPAVPPQLDPHTAKAVNDVIEYGGKAAVSLAAIVGFFRLVAQPIMNWRSAARDRRKKAEAELIRSVLAEEIQKLDAICAREETVLDEYQKVISRQEQIFRDLDILLEVALDNRDRLDEMNSLLDEVGFCSRDRRDRESDVILMVEGLLERRKQRRRKLPLVIGPEES